MSRGAGLRRQIAIPVSASEFRDRWLRSLLLVFAESRDFPGSLAQWTDQVYQPGYTFSILDLGEPPDDNFDQFIRRNEYERLCAFARTCGDDFFLAQHWVKGWSDGNNPERNVAGVFSSGASWDEMRAVTRGWSEGGGIEPAALTFGWGSGDMYIWSPRSLWGMHHSDDGGVVIAGTWGPDVTLIFREAFGLEGEGWTERLKEGFGGLGSGAGRDGPPVSDLYLRG